MEAAAATLAKYNFADNCVPKCNLGTRAATARYAAQAVQKRSFY